METACFYHNGHLRNYVDSSAVDIAALSPLSPAFRRIFEEVVLVRGIENQ